MESNTCDEFKDISIYAWINVLTIIFALASFCLELL